MSLSYCSTRRVCHCNEPAMRPKGIICNLEGIVVDMHHYLFNIWNKVCGEILQSAENIEDGLEMAKEDFEDYFLTSNELDGLRRYMSHKGVSLEEGGPNDSEDTKTVWGAIQKQKKLFKDKLAEIPLKSEVLEILRVFKKEGTKTVVYSTHEHCKEIIAAKKLGRYFDCIFDGSQMEDLGLQPEPHPDIFRQCCLLIDVKPEKCILISNRPESLMAGREASFGLIVAVDPTGGVRKEIRGKGGNLIVTDVKDLNIWSLNDAFPLANSAWTLSISDPSLSKHMETLTTLGNGYYAIRGARDETEFPWDSWDTYPGMYIAGGYNRLTTEMDGQKISHESLVNFPKWASVTWREEGKEWFSWTSKEYSIEQFEEKLNVYDGSLVVRYTAIDREGHATTVISQRFVHLKKRHLGLIKYSLVAENWAGTIQVKSSIDGSVENRGVARYSQLSGKHLKVLQVEEFDVEDCHPGLAILVDTVQSHLRVSVAKKMIFFVANDKEIAENIETIKEEEKIAQIFSFPMKPGKILIGETVAAICTSRDRGILNPLEGAEREVKRTTGKRYNHLLSTHCAQWNSAWQRFDVSISLVEDTSDSSGNPGNPAMNVVGNSGPSGGSGHSAVSLPIPPLKRSDSSESVGSAVVLERPTGNPGKKGLDFSSFQEQIKSKGAESLTSSQLQFILRFHTFHLLQSSSPTVLGTDTSLPARGLHGEAYRGHILWDELFVLPTFLLRVPEITRSLLLYRYYRLDAARDIAKSKGYFGACFPWQSSSSGYEETPPLHLNPLSKSWEPDLSYLQLHVNIAVFYNFWHYHTVTGDQHFMELYGDEVLLEIARFWGNKASWNNDTGRYDICDVMGPDEFHEKFPGNSSPGFKNNAYTNVMVAWCLDKALLMFSLLTPTRKRELRESLHLSQGELDKWRKITQKLAVPFHGRSIISQFEGYDQLEELDWEKYRQTYGNIQRMDRILKAEGKSPDSYKVHKQPDVCMLFYLLSEEQLLATLRRLGYAFSPELIARTIYYYLERTSHGSTLSLVVFSHILHSFDSSLSWALYKEFLLSDICDTQGGTTGEGIHLVPMASSLLYLFCQVTGLDTSRHYVGFDPHPPSGLKLLKFRFQWNHRWISVELSEEDLVVTGEQNGTSLFVYFRDTLTELLPGAPMKFHLNPT